ncbi:MAG: hypothetical protein ACREBD_34025, partial [Blastocatellia bacterium]
MTPVVTTESTSEAIIHSLLEKIKTIEWELNTLKAGVLQLARREGVKIHTFADLKGIAGGQWNLSEEEIDAVLYREPPNM